MRVIKQRRSLTFFSLNQYPIALSIKRCYRKLIQDYSYYHLWTWIKIRSNSFIKTLLNIMKQKSTKLPQKLSPAKENATPHFKVHCTKTDDISRVAVSFFFSQKIPVFKSDSVFIDSFDRLVTVYLHFYLPIFTFILQILKFVQCFYDFVFF